MTTHFADLLQSAIRASGSPACVGLDPVLSQLPEPLGSTGSPVEAIRIFCRGVIDAVAGTVAAVKPQSACFERFGSAGVAVLEETISYARSKGLVVILDVKRGDIGTTCNHYAVAAATAGAHCVTVNGYLGQSGITPFLDAGLGVFILVRTSNPDSDAFQNLMLQDGRTVAEAMADQVAMLGQSWLGDSGLSDVGAVVGATKSTQAAALRKRMPNQFFLIPGYGAQGGTAEDIRSMVRPEGGGVIVSASRSIIYPKPVAVQPSSVQASTSESWITNIKTAAADFRKELQTVVN